MEGKYKPRVGVGRGGWVGGWMGGTQKYYLSGSALWGLVLSVSPIGLFRPLAFAICAHPLVTHLVHTRLHFVSCCDLDKSFKPRFVYLRRQVFYLVASCHDFGLQAGFDRCNFRLQCADLLLQRDLVIIVSIIRQLFYLLLDVFEDVSRFTNCFVYASTVTFTDLCAQLKY